MDWGKPEQYMSLLWIVHLWFHNWRYIWHVYSW